MLSSKKGSIIINEIKTNKKNTIHKTLTAAISEQKGENEPSCISENQPGVKTYSRAFFSS